MLNGLLLSFANAIVDKYFQYFCLFVDQLKIGYMLVRLILVNIYWSYTSQIHIFLNFELLLIMVSLEEDKK